MGKQNPGRGVQSGVWAWGDGVTRLGTPPGPCCDLWFLALHPCSVIPQGQALWLHLPGPTCFRDSGVDVRGVGPGQGSPSHGEMQTSPPYPPRDRWHGIAGTASPARHPRHGTPIPPTSHGRAPELGSRVQMTHLWPICKKPPRRASSSPLAGPHPLPAGCQCPRPCPVPVPPQHSTSRPRELPGANK